MQQRIPDENEIVYFEFLDELRASGKTNMFAAGSFLEEAFDLSESDARKILADWMRSYGDRHPQKKSEGA